jgi:hypothetical protein
LNDLTGGQGNPFTRLGAHAREPLLNPPSGHHGLGHLHLRFRVDGALIFPLPGNLQHIPRLNRDRRIFGILAVHLARNVGRKRAAVWAMLITFKDKAAKWCAALGIAELCSLLADAANDKATIEMHGC